jgi:hypothetical protein
MAYLGRFRSLIGVFAAAFAVASVVTEPIASAYRHVADFVIDFLTDVDLRAADSIALDRASHALQLTDEPAESQARSYRRRGLLHARWRAGRYDPGWLANAAAA